MSALATLAIVASVLLAVVFAVGVAVGVKTRAMKDRDLWLAEELAGEDKDQEPPLPSARRARRFSEISPKAAEQREILEQATFDWEQLGSEAQRSFARDAARRREEDPEELSSFINDLIRSGRRPDAGVLLVNREPEPRRIHVDSQIEIVREPEYFTGTPAYTVTWYRDQLLSLHPAYLAPRASLLERVTQLITVTIRVERGGEIPQRRRYPVNRRYRDPSL
jgi:hypothetical protein